MVDQITAIKVKLTPNSPKLFAIASLEMKGGWTIKGFRIQESNKENRNGDMMWITAPSYKDSGAQGKWHSIVYVPDRDTWNKLEDMIYEAYQKKLSESTSTFPVDDIKVDEVKF